MLLAPISKRYFVTDHEVENALAYWKIRFPPFLSRLLFVVGTLQTTRQSEVLVWPRDDVSANVTSAAS